MDNQKPIEVKHKWMEQEKQVNCKICLLASNMKDCKNCPFYGPHTQMTQSQKLSS